MSTANTALRVAELDFFAIKNNLKTFLQSQSEFTDYDFEGSGLSVLLDILAYNTYYNSYYLNMAANEAFLDTAQLRQNILSLAKNINYIPTSRRGARALVNILVTPTESEDQITNVITLQKYHRLLGNDKNNVNYPFVAMHSNTATRTSNTFSFSNVTIRQGEVVNRNFDVLANNATRRFEIPSANVDTDTLTVVIQESALNEYLTEYQLAGDITELTGNSTVYFVEENENLNYTIYFGDDVIGKRPANGNIVKVTYIDTSGPVGNNITKFYSTQQVAGLFSSNVAITTVDSSYGGSEKEDTDQIRFRAPYFYSAQNRAVIPTDYEVLLTKDYPNIDGVTVWGGEDNDPPVYGKVYISLKTKGFYTLTDTEKNSIKDDIIRNRNVLTVTPEIVDPDYSFILVRGKVNYDTALTSKTPDEINTLVKNAAISYSNDYLNTFRSTFKKYKMQTYIEQADPSIISTDIDYYLQKRLTVVPNQKQNYTLEYNTKLRKGDSNLKLYTYPQLKVVDLTNIDRLVFFEEVPDSFTGIDSVDIVNPGRNYKTAPTVTITGDGTGAAAVATIVNGKINSIQITDKGSGYTRATVSFSGGSGKEAVANAKPQARYGTLRTYYYKVNGEKIIVNSNAGEIDYELGKITLTALYTKGTVVNEFFADNILTVNAAPSENNLVPSMNRILALDSNNIQSIQVEIVAEK